MANPSISLPDWMDKEVERRKHNGEPKSHYVQKALQSRFVDEDAGEWTDPDIEPPSDNQTADAD